MNELKLHLAAASTPACGGILGREMFIYVLSMIQVSDSKDFTMQVLNFVVHTSKIKESLWMNETPILIKTGD